MASSIIGGAVVGAAFEELLKAVLDVKGKTTAFRKILSDLESTLFSISPMIKEMEKFNRQLDCPDEQLNVFIQQLNNGKKLVDRCSQVICLNYYRKHQYTKQLRKLDESIRRFFGLFMQAHQTKDTLEIFGEAKDVEANGARISSGENNTFDNSVGFSDSCGVPEPPALTVGLDVPLKELKMRLFQDGPSVLVLSAPGGCGKTTLALMFCGDEEVKGKFKDNIFFVPVSSTPNLKVIIQKLIQHKGYQVPEFQSDEDAVHRLENLLKKIEPEPVLLVLDDVWYGSESLIEKFAFQIPDYKILVTSRSVFPRFDSPYNLNLLNHDDAMTLFCHHAFPPNGSSYMPDEDLVKKVVISCKRFPLALKVVGRSLYGQPEAVWKSRVIESEGHSILDKDDLLNCLKSSIDALNEKLKDCFVDLGAFPEDQRIPAAALIDMWAELYNLDVDGVQAIANLRELSTRNLVNILFTRKDAMEVEGCYNEKYVMQHDLLRDLAIHQSSQDPPEQRKKLFINISGNNFPKWCMDLKQQPMSARFLSISTDEMFTSCWSNMHLPEVEVLVLNFQTKNYTLPEFMKKMDKLKVLIVINYGFCATKLNNVPIDSLSNLKRIRLEHVFIPSLNNTRIKLNNLEKISLIMCEISQAFRNCDILLPAVLPNLVEVNIDYCNDLVELPGGLSDLVSLKKLSVTNCHKLSYLPERIGNLENLDVLKLNACTDLSELPSSIGGLHKLSFLDISDCCSIRRMPEQMGELCNLRKIYMRGCLRLSELPQSINELKNLKDVLCDEEISGLWEPFSCVLPNLNIKVHEENADLDWLQF